MLPPAAHTKTCGPVISKPIQVRTFSSDIQVDKTLIARRAVAHSKECQLRRFLLYAHLINVLSSAAVNHIIQTPVPAPLMNRVLSTRF